MASRQWTEQHSIDLVEAYIGAEIERLPKGQVWIGGDEWHIPLPDMSKDGEWLMRCLEVWTKANRGRPIVAYEINGECYTCFGYQFSASGLTLREALAWALWEARNV